MNPVIIYARATGTDWALHITKGDGWRQNHLGAFGASLARRHLDLPVGHPVEFRLL